MYTMHYAVFSGDGYYLYNSPRNIFGGGYYLYFALRSIFGGWILSILCATQCFRGVDTIYTIHYVVFSGDG